MSLPVQLFRDYMDQLRGRVEVGDVDAIHQALNVGVDPNALLLPTLQNNQGAIWEVLLAFGAQPNHDTWLMDVMGLVNALDLVHVPLVHTAPVATVCRCGATVFSLLMESSHLPSTKVRIALVLVDNGLRLDLSMLTQLWKHAAASFSSTLLMAMAPLATTCDVSVVQARDVEWLITRAPAHVLLTLLPQVLMTPAMLVHAVYRGDMDVLAYVLHRTVSVAVLNHALDYARQQGAIVSVIVILHEVVLRQLVQAFTPARLQFLHVLRRELERCLARVDPLTTNTVAWAWLDAVQADLYHPSGYGRVQDAFEVVAADLDTVAWSESNPLAAMRFVLFKNMACIYKHG